MKKIVWLFLFGYFVQTAYSQQIPDASPYAGLISRDSLKHALDSLAGPYFEGRETAMPGGLRAADFLVAYFRKIGLNPGNQGDYLLNYPLFQDSLEAARIIVDADSFELYHDFDARVGPNSTSELYASEIVYAGYGMSDSDRDDYKNIDVRGKIVMILDGMPRQVLQSQLAKGVYDPFGKLEAAQKHGAAAVLIIQHDFPHAPFNEKGKLYREGFKKNIRPNSYFISASVAKKIMGPDFALLKEGSLKPKTYFSPVIIQFRKKTSLLRASDVLGFLPGLDSSGDIVVISAHYDHLGRKDSVIYFGADDDGSGTVSLLEIARAFTTAARSGARPLKSILFLANSGEEKGLWGSAYYSEHPVYKLDHTSADLNIDMIGRTDSEGNHQKEKRYIYLIGDNRISSALRPLSESVNRKCCRLNLDYKYDDPKDPQRLFFRSDHYNFAKKGVPVIFYFAGIHKDYHQPTDTPDKIDYELLESRARFIFYTAWQIANSKNLLKRDIPLTNLDEK